MATKITESFEIWCDDNAGVSPWPPTRASFGQFWSEKRTCFEQSDADDAAKVWAAYSADGFKIVCVNGRVINV